MQDPEEGLPAGQGSPQEITFQYTRSNFYRVVHVDGMIGGLTPTGFVHLAVWSQHAAYPSSLTQQLVEGQMGGTVDVPAGQLIPAERQIEAALMLTPDTAKALIRWLKRVIGDSEESQS